MMKWIKRVAMTVGVVMSLFVAAIVILIYIDTHPAVHEFPVTQTGVLAESEAIAITREAIASSGRTPDEFSTLAWGTREWQGKPERVFARNTLTPNNGYVIWKHESGAPAKTVHVSIEKNNTAFSCKVYKVK